MYLIGNYYKQYIKQNKMFLGNQKIENGCIQLKIILTYQIVIFEIHFLVAYLRVPITESIYNISNS
jgi:hypothetical protein